jgi:CRISPR-associated protein Cas5 subtype I-B
MKYVQFKLWGEFGHFKKGAYNNTQLTSSIPQKSNIIGLMGNILEKRRWEMNPNYAEFSNNLVYNVQLNNPVIKKMHGFNGQSFHKRSVERARSNGTACYYYMANVEKPVNISSRSPMIQEILVDPSYTITIGLVDGCTDKTKAFFDDFVFALKNSDYGFGVYLGSADCLAKTDYVDSGDAVLQDGNFETLGFVSNLDREVYAEADVAIDLVYTSMLEDRLYDGSSEKRVYLSTDKLSSTGEHYVLGDKTKLVLI